MYLKIEVEFSQSAPFRLGILSVNDQLPQHKAVFLDDKGTFLGRIDPSNDLPSVRNFAFALIQYIADIYTVIERRAYFYSVISASVVENGELTVEVRPRVEAVPHWHSLVYPNHGLVDLTLTQHMPTGSTTHLGSDVIKRIYWNANHLFTASQFRRAVFYASAAIRYPDLSAMFSNQVIEAVCEGFDGKDKNAKYENMRNTLGVSTEMAVFKTGETKRSLQDEKHGKFISRTWEDRRLYIENSSRILFFYAFVLIENNPLWENPEPK